jgi:enoyl-CoA hydratase
MKYLSFEVKDHTGILSISRPEALNALNRDVIAEIRQTLAEAAAGNLRCLIITGAGEKAFVAGADIGEMAPLAPEEAKDFSRAGNEMMDAIEDFPAPVIAAVNGYALGGGFELALACDIRLAAENAVFSFPEAGIGIIPGYGGVKRIVSLIGTGRAKELLFTARRVTAAEALSLGIVNHVYPAGELMAKALALAAQIAANAPRAVQGEKRLANMHTGLTAPEYTDKETVIFKACFGTRDQRESMAAFLEKRKPEPFTGN